MQHPLHGAYERVSRAHFHIRELKGCLSFVADSIKKKTLPYEKYVASQLRLKPEESFSPGSRPIEIPPEMMLPQFPFIMGETIYNLRSALDYLVYEISGHRSGTQFPIEDVKLSKDRKRGFDTKRKTFLKGVSNSHVAAIELLQPYKGCTWTKTLRNISNPDKHRHLTIMLGHWDASTVYKGVEPQVPDNDSGKPGFSDAHTQVHLQSALSIKFPDGSAVIETLQILSRDVMGAIKSFESDL